MKCLAVSRAALQLRRDAAPISARADDVRTIGGVQQWVHSGTRSYLDMPAPLAATAEMCNGALIGFNALDAHAVRTIIDPVRSALSLMSS